MIPKSGKLRDQVGSPLWMAPEILNDQEYTEKIDVYSFAICMWEILTNNLPWENLNLNQLTRAVSSGIRPEIPSHIDRRLADLVIRCWDTDADKRPSFDQVIEDLNKMEKKA